MIEAFFSSSHLWPPEERLRAEQMLEAERQAWETGFSAVAGVDEAGRGPLAGPLVAAAVRLRAAIPGLNDSKKLTEKQRETLFEAIQSGGNDVAVVVVDAPEIDRGGIQAANLGAMARAIGKLESCDYVLVDGFALRGVAQPSLKLIKGDQRSLSIAAASIVAKVTRDRMMAAYDAEYPGYGFGQHKGYGTAAHLAAIEQLGPTPIHRYSFAPLARSVESGDLFRPAPSTS